MLVREALGQECRLERMSLIWRVGRYIPSRCVTKSKEYDAGNARGATETSVASSESLRRVLYTCVLSLVPWPPPNPIQASRMDTSALPSATLQRAVMAFPKARAPPSSGVILCPKSRVQIPLQVIQALADLTSVFPSCSPTLQWVPST